MSKTKNDQLKIFTSRFPDQGECGGGMIVIAKDLKEAKKKLKEQFKEDNDGDEWDWQVLLMLFLMVLLFELN